MKKIDDRPVYIVYLFTSIRKNQYIFCFQTLFNTPKIICFNCGDFHSAKHCPHPIDPHAIRVEGRVRVFQCNNSHSARSEMRDSMDSTLSRRKKLPEKREAHPCLPACPAVPAPAQPRGRRAQDVPQQRVLEQGRRAVVQEPGRQVEVLLDDVRVPREVRRRREQGERRGRQRRQRGQGSRLRDLLPIGPLLELPRCGRAGGWRLLDNAGWTGSANKKPNCAASVSPAARASSCRGRLNPTSRSAAGTRRKSTQFVRQSSCANARQRLCTRYG